MSERARPIFSVGGNGSVLAQILKRMRTWMRAPTRVATALLLCAVWIVPPTDVRAQSMGDLLAAVRNGGGWMAIPIEDGRGSVETSSIPTGRFTLEGCARVWSGHSGSWRLRAEDLLGDDVMEATLDAGEAVRFRHRPGPRARLRVDVLWSEPENTTLFLWVGLGSANDGSRDPCEPRR